jgi:hypothetical protein
VGGVGLGDGEGVGLGDGEGVGLGLGGGEFEGLGDVGGGEFGGLGGGGTGPVEKKTLTREPRGTGVPATGLVRITSPWDNPLCRPTGRG